MSDQQSTNRRIRCAFWLTAAIAVMIFGTRAQGETVTVSTEDGGTWTMEVVPRGTVARASRPQVTASNLVPPAPQSNAIVQASNTDVAFEELAQHQAPAVEQPLPTPALATPQKKQGKKKKQAADKSSTAIETDSHGIEFVPGPSMSADGDAKDVKRLAALWRAIPFNRAEYLANPSYRFDTALELYFGEMRPTTINRTYQARAIEKPVYSPYRPYFVTTPRGRSYGRYGLGLGLGGFGGYGSSLYFNPQRGPYFQPIFPAVTR